MKSVSFVSNMLVGMRGRMNASSLSSNAGSHTCSIITAPKFSMHSRASAAALSRSSIPAMQPTRPRRGLASEAKPESETANNTEKQTQQQQAADADKAASGDAANVATLQEQLKARTAELEDVTSQLKYAVADKMNAIKMAKADVESAKQYGIQKFATDMLEVADTLDMALACLSPAERSGASRVMQEFATGVDMTARIMQKKLQAHGLTQINPLNQKFDPMQHQALFQMPGPQANMVGSVVKPGYSLNGRVIRPAQVGVTMQAPQQQTPPANDSKA